MLLLCIHLINYRYLNHGVLKKFILLIVPYAIVNWINFWASANNNDLNILANNLIRIYEFVFIGWFYSQLIESTETLKKIKILNWILIVVSILNILFIQGFYEINSYTIIVGSCIAVYYIFEYFKEMIQQTQSINLLQNPFFWISIGYLFHLIGLFILACFGEYFKYINDYNSFLPIWHLFNNLITTILYSCLLIAFSFRLKPTIT